MENYLEILKDSLEKKSALLDRIEAYNENQKDLFQAEELDAEQIDAYIEGKDELITELDQLDEGFEALYEKVSEELKENREKYADQIRTLQDLIKEVTEKTVSVQAQEARYRAEAESFFAKHRSKIRDGRIGSKTAMTYYRAATGTGIPGAQIFDSKK